MDIWYNQSEEIILIGDIRRTQSPALKISTMRNRLLYIFLLILLSVADASAQTDTIRYVNAKTGKYANDGKTWATAKDNVQDAINDLYNYMQTQNVHSGSVYVAAGTYAPSESTGDGSSVLSTSFKIYDGIHVYGGSNADNPEATPDQRVLSARLARRSVGLSQ